MDEGTKITNDMTKHLVDDAADAAGKESNDDGPLGDEETNSDGAAPVDEEVPAEAAPHESTISAISDVGPEDPLPEDSGEKPFGESVISA